MKFSEIVSKYNLDETLLNAFDPSIEVYPDPHPFKFSTFQSIWKFRSKINPNISLSESLIKLDPSSYKECLVATIRSETEAIHIVFDETMKVFLGYIMTNNKVSHNNYLLLVNSLTNLSKPYKEQVRLYPDYVNSLEEIIANFDTAFRSLPGLMKRRFIPYEAVIEILTCHNLISMYLSENKIQNNKDFEFGNYWNLIREHSENALMIMPKNASTQSIG